MSNIPEDAKPSVSIIGHSEATRGLCEMNTKLLRWLEQNETGYATGREKMQAVARAECKRRRGKKG